MPQSPDLFGVPDELDPLATGFSLPAGYRLHTPKVPLGYAIDTHLQPNAPVAAPIPQRMSEDKPADNPLFPSAEDFGPAVHEAVSSSLPQGVGAAVDYANTPFSELDEPGVAGSFADAVQIPQSKGELAGQIAMAAAPGIVGSFIKKVAPMTKAARASLAMKPEVEAVEKAVKVPLTQEEKAALKEGLQARREAKAARDAESSATAGPLDLAAPYVITPKRVAYPEVYDHPASLARRAAAMVKPEDPALKAVFGPKMSRGLLYEMSKEGTLPGDLYTGDIPPFKVAPNAKGSEAARRVMTPANAQKSIDLISEVRKYPDLFKGMASWYTMEPAAAHFENLHGEDAIQAYNHYNTVTGMFSPGSDVLTEMNRGTGALWLAKKGRIQDMIDYGGGLLKAGEPRPGRPEDMEFIMGHPYHKTAHMNPLEKYIKYGILDMDSAKVASYIKASGISPSVWGKLSTFRNRPDLLKDAGFQSRWAVGDSHWARGIGLPDVRTNYTPMSMSLTAMRDKIGGNADVPEMWSLAPWWRDHVAKPAGLEAVPAQAVVWGGAAPATGVDTDIGRPKLELQAMRIMNAAHRLGISPQNARDRVFRFLTHAGVAGGVGIGASELLHPGPGSPGDPSAAADYAPDQEEE